MKGRARLPAGDTAEPETPSFLEPEGPERGKGWHAVIRPTLGKGRNWRSP